MKPEVKCAPKYQVGDLVQTVMVHPETGKPWKGQIAIFEGTDQRNAACVYKVLHYGADGSSDTYNYWEFELRTQ